MKTTLTRAAVVASLLLQAPLQAEDLPAGQVNFGTFTKPSNGELVQINLSSDMIAMALQLVGKNQPDMTEALGGLHSIRVNVVGLDDQNRDEITTRIKSVRSELGIKGWQPIVSVQEKKEDVGIYLKTRGKEVIEGLVITVLDGRKEAVFINVVGDIKMDKLGALGEKLNLDAIKKAAEAIMKQATAPKEQGNAGKE